MLYVPVITGAFVLTYRAPLVIMKNLKPACSRSCAICPHQAHFHCSKQHDKLVADGERIVSHRGQLACRCIAYDCCSRCLLVIRRGECALVNENVVATLQLCL